MLNKSGKSGHPCLVPNLRGDFQLFTIECDVSHGFVISAFYCVKVGPFFACFLERFLY